MNRILRDKSSFITDSQIPQMQDCVIYVGFTPASPKNAFLHACNYKQKKELLAKLDLE